MHDPKRADIPFGEVNAVTRQRLSSLWGKSDRAARKVIEGFRMDPHATDCIISHSDGRGYWRSADIEEIEGFVAEIDARKESLERLSLMAKRVLSNLRTEATQSELPF